MRTSKKTATRKPARKSAPRKTTTRKTTRKTTSKSSFGKMSTGKKVGIAALLAGGIYYAFGSSTPNAPGVTQKSNTPVGGGKFGYNADGTARPLTDAEANLILTKNPGHVVWYNDPANKISQGNYTNDIMGWVKNHWWLNWGTTHPADYTLV